MRIFKKDLSSIIFGILIFILAGHGWAATGVTVPRIETAPLMDGQLDDACWGKTPWQSGLTILNLPETQAPVQTYFKLVHDERFLYVAAKMDEPNIAGLKAMDHKRDGPVFRDDAFQIFIDTNGDKATYFHFVVNPKGSVYDSQCEQSGLIQMSQWNCQGLRTATKTNENSWAVEIAIPLVELKLEEGSKGAWGFNVARARHAGKKPQYSSFMPASGSFHRPTRFIPLTLDDANMAAYLWDIKPLFATRTIGDVSNHVFDAKTYITNQTDQFQFFRVTCTFDTAGPESSAYTFTAGLDAGQGRVFDLHVPAELNGPATMTLTVARRRSNAALAIRQFPVQIVYSPLAIALTRPCYRNAIYATQNLKNITGIVSSSLRESVLKEQRLTVALQDDQGKTITQTTLETAARENPFSLPLPALAIGTYKVVSELIDVDGKVSHRAEQTLKKLAPFAGEVRLDENLVTRIDGKPYLPWGWFSIRPRYWSGMREKNVTAHIDYNAYFLTDVELKAWLDRSQQAGLKVIIKPYPKRSMVNPKPQRKPLSKEDAEAIRQFVGKWKTHPALLGWYIADEPEGSARLPAHMAAVRDVCAEEDPYHPCIMLNNSIGGISTYIDSAEVMMPDPYPLFFHGGHAARPMDKVGKFIKRIYEVGQGRRAAWITPQGFNYGDARADNNRQPNFVEIRNMTYQAVAEGATGFLWFAHYLATAYPDLISGMDYLAKEVALLEPAILAPQTNVKLEVLPADGTLHAVERKVGNHRFLFAINTAAYPIDATVILPRGSAETWYVLSEGRHVKAVDGRIKDRFDTYAVHIYTTDPSRTDELSVLETQKLIDEGIKALAKPGNLVFKDRGTKVTASTSKHAQRLWHVTDGAPDGLGWTAKTPNRFPDWIQIDFEKQVAADRVVVYSRNIKDATAQIQKNGEWISIGTFNRQSDDQLTVSFQPVTTSAVRVVVTSLLDAAIDPTVMEVEVYEN